MNLKYVRRLCKNTKNVSASLIIPKAIAECWQLFDKIELIFDGERLVVAPKVEAVEEK